MLLFEHLLDTQSELYIKAQVELASGQIVRHTMAITFNVCDPIIGVDIANAEEVETINAQPSIANILAPSNHGTTAFFEFGFEQVVVQSHVHSLVGRCSESLLSTRGMRRTEGNPCANAARRVSAHA